MKYFKRQIAALIFLTGTLCIVPQIAMAELIKICGQALFGVGAVVYLCTNVQQGYYNSGTCTNPMDVGQTSNTIEVNRGQIIFVCGFSRSGGNQPKASCSPLNPSFPPWMFLANEPGKYGIQGNFVVGLSASYMNESCDD